MDEVIKVSQLSKAYGGTYVVRNLNLSVLKGTVFGLLGSNGAGKTTTIECILGIKRPDGGQISVLNENPLKNRKILFERIGVQFQEANYQDRIMVGELCEVTAAFYKKAADYQQLLKQFGIYDKMNHLVSSLSGGERQRLFVILALIPDPDVVFLDELTTGLDTKARRDVWKRLYDLKAQGLTIFLTSHFMDEVEALCDNICILKKGRDVFQGTVNEAIQKSPFKNFEDTYLWFTNEEDSDDETVMYNV